MKCVYCGKELPEDSQFCQYCGKYLPTARNHPQSYENGNFDRLASTSTQPINSDRSLVTSTHKSTTKTKLPLFVSFFYIIPIVLICICLNVKLNYLNTEFFYFIVILLFVLAALFLVIASCVNKKVSVGFQVLSLVCCISSIVIVYIKPWSDADQTQKYSYNIISKQMPTLLLILVVYLATIAIIETIVFVIQVKNLSNKNRTDIFKELEQLHSLKERGIITDSEYNRLKSEMLQTITE